jgi:hypothetical protein
MIIDRRTFIHGSAFVASASVIATLIPRSLPAQPQSERSEQRADEAAGSSVVFKIDGWSLDDRGPDENEVFIRVSQSWRTAWR